MKKLIGKIMARLSKKTLLVITDSNCESQQDNNGDLVPLIWMIENLKRREGGCTMNELVVEAKRNFEGIEQIKQITIHST